MNAAQERIYQALSAACLILACLFSLGFLYVAFSSLTYPFNLEWMEGHTIDIIQRIRNGEPIYVKPSLSYIPYIYTPFYFQLSALVSFFTGVDFVAPRLVAILSTLGCAAIIYAWVRKEGGAIIHGLIGAGLFLATYKISGRWFDVARLDSLYLLLMASGLYVFYFYRNTGGAVAAGVLFAAAFFTKQAAVLALFPPFVAALFINRSLALKAAGMAAAIFVVYGTCLQGSSAGWFGFYIYDVPAGHSNDMRQVKLFWTRDILQKCSLFFLLSLVSFAWLRQPGRNAILWYAAMAIGFIGSAWVSRIHSFGHVNVLMPAHFMMALLSALLLVKTAQRDRWVALAVLVCVATQFAMLRYNPQKSIPTPESVAKGERFLEEIQKIDGDILFSELQYIQTRVGKKPYSIGMAGFDIFRSNLGEKNNVKQELKQELETAIAERKFAAVITGNFLKVRELKGRYKRAYTIEHPQEYVTGAVFFTRAAVYTPLPKAEIVPLPKEMWEIIQ